MKKPSFKIFKYFLTAYPYRSAVVLLTLLLAGLIETVGISALLPLLNVVIGTSTEAASNILTQTTNQVFSTLNLEQSFQNLLSIIVITIVMKSIIVYYAMKTVAFASTDITRDLRTNLIQSLMRAKWTYYSALPIGESSTSIATEAENAGHFFMLMGKTIAALTQAIIYAIIAFLVDWKISLFAIIFGGIAAFCFKFLIQMARNTGVDMAESLKSLLSRLTEALSGAKPLKAMGEEERFINLLAKDINQVNQAKKKQLVSNLLLQAFHEPLLIVLISAGLYWAYTFANYPVTELLLIAFLFHRLISQINMFQGTYQKTINFEGSVQSIVSAIDLASKNSELSSGTISPQFTDKISLKNLTVSYEKNIIFNDFNDVIPAHKMTVIFGPSGIGKSTLFDTVLGLLKPDNGSIFIDDYNLKKIELKKWRKQIGYVPQETFLFHDTIYQNITLGDPDISEEQVIKALQKTNAWEFVSEIEDGLNHIVGERGGKLSGGQKQRIALARAIVRNPNILILDESTTGLDKESEDIIFQSLKSMMPELTIIAISHDPKILNLADHVIHLEKQN